jgi:hypothetical protein
MSLKIESAQNIIDSIKAELLPYESWEKLPKESAAAFAAFCVFRDYGAERNIKRALRSVESDNIKYAKRYRTWREWSRLFVWYQRACDYDKYIDRLKQAERRKSIEDREAAYRSVTGKMLQAVEKKLDLMSVGELSQGNVCEWVKTAINTERELDGFNGESETNSKQLEINFSGDFKGL